MNPAQVLQILQWIALAPQALNVVQGAIDEYRKLSAAGPVSDAQLKALADRIVAQHNALPKPE